MKDKVDVDWPPKAVPCSDGAVEQAPPQSNSHGSITAATALNDCGNLGPSRADKAEDFVDNLDPKSIDNDDDNDNVDHVDDDDDDGDDPAEFVVRDGPRKKPKVSAQRQLANAAMDRWFFKNADRISRSKAGIKSAPSTQKYSLKDIFQSYEKKKIIESPREYQMELFEKAKEENTIAVLGTGSGKTLIAALLLRWTIQQEIEDRAQGKPKRVAFFLVDKVALVFQQHAVLSNNLDYPMERYCGELVDEIWSRSFWAKTCDENMAIVCTAEILNKCLHHGFIRMEQINLLVFDEAHHTKKNHPYARIVKDFYFAVQDDQRRPRILGMTASPVDGQDSPAKAAQELEFLLSSRIATVANPEMLQGSSSKATANPAYAESPGAKSTKVKEFCVHYDALKRELDTPLTRSLKLLIDDHKQFQKALVFARYAAASLGPWCADRFWQLLYERESEEDMEARAGRNLVKEYSNQVVDQCIDQVRRARGLINDHVFVCPALTTDLLSSKTIALVEILQQEFHTTLAKRCIVFVQQRNTAIMLADLLQQPEMKLPGLAVGILTGIGRVDGSHGATGIRDQMLTILKFRRGELNCIVATSVCEEGLDIPDCNVVIRFDLYNTMIQYIQSRGRARQKDSRYYHMLEKDNGRHYSIYRECQENEDSLMRFCQALPEDRLLQGCEADIEYLLQKDQGLREHTIPESGAKLDYRQSLNCLIAFVASLPHPAETVLEPEYVIAPFPEGGFIAEVTLPSVSPITRARGTVHTTKAIAKCSAAYDMCLKLLEAGYITSDLLPVFTKQLPAMRNARLAVSSRKRTEYEMRTKPRLWSALGQPTELHATVLALARPEALGRHSTPLVILTRQPLPRVAEFPLFFGQGPGKTSKVQCVPMAAPLRFGDAGDKRLADLTALTLMIFRDIFSKEYEATASDLPYWVAPVRGSFGHRFRFSTVQDAGQVIDWDTASLARQEKIEFDLNQDYPDGFFADKFVVDPFDGSRKFVLRRRRRDMKPLDPVPDGIPAPSHRAWRHADHTILNYSMSLWSNSRSRIHLREDQPVVEAALQPIRRNLLDDDVSGDMEPKTCFLILEILRISPLPVPLVAMAYNFPAIIHRIESNMIALDGCNVLGLGAIRADLALEAFTKDSDNMEEHSAEQIDFQRGMGNNYERLEWLGDTFLKMATTVSIFTLLPDKNEFDQHVERMLLLCNQNLFNNAIRQRIQLEQYIRSRSFNRRTWYPELVLRKGKKSSAADTAVHGLADKTIADVCEAVIGAAYLTGQDVADGFPAKFDMAVRAVHAVVCNKENRRSHPMKAWADYYAAYTPPSWLLAQPTAVQREMAGRFAARTGYAFRNPRLLRSAFSHPSYPSVWEEIPSYQRLEFLGDALLDMAVADDLFRRFPGADPQWLTEHKMAMVSNQFLGCLAFELGFHRALLASNAAVQGSIAEYAAEMDALRDQARDEAVRAGRPADDYARDYWYRLGGGAEAVKDSSASRQQQQQQQQQQQSSKTPKCLPDVVEAYLGAVFVDSGYDYGQVQAFFDRHVAPFFADMSLYDTYASKHPISVLLSVATQRLGCTEVRLLTKAMPFFGGEGGGEDSGDEGGGGGGEEGGGGGAGSENGDEDEGREAGGGSGGGGGDIGNHESAALAAFGATKMLCGVWVHGGEPIAFEVCEGAARYGKTRVAKRALAVLEGMTREAFRERFKCDCTIKVA